MSTAAPTESRTPARRPKAKAARAAAAAPPAPDFRADAYGLKVAADPTRLRILHLLRDGERHVGAMCEAMTLSQPAVSHSLSVMKLSGVVESRREGKRTFYSLTPEGKTLLSAVAALHP